MVNDESNKAPSIEPNPAPISPIPGPLDAPTKEELREQYDEEPSLLDEPVIPAECLKDLEEVLKAGLDNYPKAAKMAKTAPENFRYLYHDFWSNLPIDDSRRWKAVEMVEEAIKDRE